MTQNDDSSHASASNRASTSPNVGGAIIKLIRSAALVAIAALLGIFVVQNLATINIVFLVWAITAPQALVFVLMFGLGLAFGYLIRTFHWEPFQRKRQQ